MRLFEQWFSKCGPWTSSITWEPDRNPDSQVLLKPANSASLGEGLRYLCFNKPSWDSCHMRQLENQCQRLRWTDVRYLFQNNSGKGKWMWVAVQMKREGRDLMSIKAGEGHMAILLCSFFKCTFEIFITRSFKPVKICNPYRIPRETDLLSSWSQLHKLLDLATGWVWDHVVLQNTWTCWQHLKNGRYVLDFQLLLKNREVCWLWVCIPT